MGEIVYFVHYKGAIHSIFWAAEGLSTACLFMQLGLVYSCKACICFDNWWHVMTCHVMLCHVMTWYDILRHVMICYDISCMPWHAWYIIAYHDMPQYVISCHDMTQHDMTCHDMSSIVKTNTCFTWVDKPKLHEKTGCG